MIVVMRKESTGDDLDAVQRRIESHGLRAHVSDGVERTVVGVLGQPFRELKDELELMQGVMEVVLVSKPYKLSGRDFKKEDTVVKVGDVSIGGDELVVMAGPCAVEDEEQVLSTARVVKAAGATILREAPSSPGPRPTPFVAWG